MGSLLNATPAGGRKPPAHTRALEVRAVNHKRVGPVTDE
jgi:hypothetical protein